MTLVLGIESSCDETACALVEDGRILHASTIASSAELQASFGGVVPELASRAHLEYFLPCLETSLAKADKTLEEIDLFAACFGPGLLGSLLVGLSAGKTLSLMTGKPFVGVHHLIGHIAVNYVDHPNLEPPFLAAVMSGGHCHLMLVKDYVTYELLAQTRDDAPGECFDKVAREAFLPYPGGPVLDRLSQTGDPHYYSFPQARFADSLDFSFSGLKTAALREIHRAKFSLQGHMDQDLFFDQVRIHDLAASLTQSMADIIIDRIQQALKAHPTIQTLVLGGGVSANSTIRRTCEAFCKDHSLAYFSPAISLCGDNAVMIASQAYFQFTHLGPDDLSLDAYPNLPITYKKEDLCFVPAL